MRTILHRKPYCGHKVTIGLPITCAYQIFPPSPNTTPYPFTLGSVLPKREELWIHQTLQTVVLSRPGLRTIPLPRLNEGRPPRLGSWVESSEVTHKGLVRGVLVPSKHEDRSRVSWAVTKTPRPGFSTPTFSVRGRPSTEGDRANVLRGRHTDIHHVGGPAGPQR